MDTESARADGGGGSGSTDRGCPKCGHTDVEAISMATGDGIVGSLVDLPTEELTVISCSICGFSELYRDVDSDGYEPRDLFLE